jgi:hypothetical protein
MASKRPRSFGHSDLSHDSPPCKSMWIHMKSSPVEGRIMRGFREDNIEGQLMATCLRAEHDIWLWLLPKDDDNDSLFFNTGQNWEHMYLCLYKAHFMSLDKASGKVIINKHQWWLAGSHFASTLTSGCRWGHIMGSMTLGPSSSLLLVTGLNMILLGKAPGWFPWTEHLRCESRSLVLPDKRWDYCCWRCLLWFKVHAECYG